MKIIKKISNIINFARTDKQMNVLYSHSNIKFHNYWTVEPEKNWFYQFIIGNGFLENNKETAISFYSVFGSKKKLLADSGKKIFFSGENMQGNTILSVIKKYADYCLDQVDLAMGFDEIDNPKYLRFPLWITYLIKPTDNLADIKSKINEINNQLTRKNTTREEFAVQISRHDINGIRSKMVNIAIQVAPVKCAGKFMNNTSDLKEHYHDDKVEYMKNFKFNICPENASQKGYVTEKIFESFIAGCIPIYWGGGKKELVEPKIINQEAFIYYTEGKEDELIEQVKALYTDKKKYEDFISIPPFKDGAAEEIWSIVCNFKNRIKEIL